MTNIERMPDFESPDHDEEYEAGRLVLGCLELAQEVVMDEEEDSDRSDLWYVSWADLQAPINTYMDTSEEQIRLAAAKDIHQLYMDELLRMYPQLQGIEHSDDMMLATALIPDFPKCVGSYTTSQYEAENGNHRWVSCTEVRLADRTAANFKVVDEGPADISAYSLGYDGDGGVFMGTGDTVRRASEEMEMLYAVHPSQAANLQSILEGSVYPFELQSKLVEIMVCAEQDPDSDPVALEAILTRAVEIYHERRAKRADNTLHATEPPVKALRELYGILQERVYQLDSPL